MPNRVRGVLQYDGTRYRGWQRQPDAPTVQETCERALAAGYARWREVQQHLGTLVAGSELDALLGLNRRLTAALRGGDDDLDD